MAADRGGGGQLGAARDLLRAARRVVALTGAGISTPSGIPDFRSEDSGLWVKHHPFEVASITGFRHYPERFYEWIRPLARLMLDAEPNPAHRALARLEAGGMLHAIVTQNIDLLHTRAGSRVVHELHGSMREASCVECFRTAPAEQAFAQFMVDGALPRCPSCGGLLKPNVILFGEQLPYGVLQAARRAVRAADVLLVAGSSLEVSPAAEMPLMALAAGARLIVVNYAPTFVDGDADVVIREDVADVLPRLADLLEETPA